MTTEHSTIVATPYAQRERIGLIARFKSALGILGLVLIAFVIVLGGWFLFTAVRIEILVVEQDGSPVFERDIDIAGGLSLPLGNIRLLRPGEYEIAIKAPGYVDAREHLLINGATASFEFELIRIAGTLSVMSTPSGATIHLNETLLGITPISDAEAPAGKARITASLPLYTPVEQSIDIEGRGAHQSLALLLTANFARIDLTSTPSNAELIIDRVPRGQTPASLDLEAGTRRITLQKDGYASRTVDLEVAAGIAQSPATIILDKASARLTVASEPTGAVVLLDGTYQGVTPITLSLAPERTQTLRVRKTGFEERERQVRLRAGASERVRLELTRAVGEVTVSVWPQDATLLVNAEAQPSANTRLELTAEPHRFELRRPGYESEIRTVTPRAGFSQALNVRMMTVADARLARMKPEITTSSNQKLVLLKPTPIELGASRREAGRRANEVLRRVPLTREFYLATHEVTNAEFRAFAPGHRSGTHAGHSLDGDTHPAVRVSWAEAARYCNWLSEQEGLDPVYVVRGGQVEGAEVARSGYRLPTEAEWAWAARFVSAAEPLKRMPWGHTPKPPERHGNYADTSATYVVSRALFGYQDNFIVSAPVGRFAPNTHGIFDLGGNVDEWGHDFYEQSPAREQPPDPTGPAEGEYHVIRGSSWMHGSVSDLRLSYRDYGSDGRADLGFRIAKYVTE